MVGRLYTSPMQLLVSVRNAHEAEAALAGGADIIDAKEPLGGALGRVDASTFEQIVRTVSGRRPVSAALGDLNDERLAEGDAHEFAAAGAAFVKVGFAGIQYETQVAALIAAAVAGGVATGAEVVAVAYADHLQVAALPADVILRAAIRGGAQGVLLDTAAKGGPSLPELLSTQHLSEWVHRAQRAELSVALAGRLTLEELPIALHASAEIVGVRGAACDGGREGVISAAKVRELQAALRMLTRHTPSTAGLAGASGGSDGRRQTLPLHRPT
jgi:uncharacterized protein (UPF0264 family)